MDVNKIARANQTCIINKYKDFKHKVLKCDASTYFNK